MGVILKGCKEVIRAATDADVAVHVKLFEAGGVERQSAEHSILRTVRRVPSDREHQLNRGPAKGHRPLLRKREDTEKFVIVMGERGKAARLRDQYAVDSDPKVNSAYNYVLDKSEHFWVSNDLKAAVKEGTYYSTSKDWQDYYMALAVCLVSPPLSSAGPVPSESVRGLFIVDSLSNGIFDFEFSRQLIGYLGHRIWDYLRAVERLTDGHGGSRAVGDAGIPNARCN